MRHTAFGHRTGLRVSAYTLVTADFGTGRGAGAEPAAQPESCLGTLDVQPTDAQCTRPAEVSRVLLGVSHEGIAASPDRLQEGAVDRVTTPVPPVA